MIGGVITTRDVLVHAALIVRSFGFSTYLRCLRVIATRQHTTFLAIVMGA